MNLCDKFLAWIVVIFSGNMETFWPLKKSLKTCTKSFGTAKSPIRIVPLIGCNTHGCTHSPPAHTHIQWDCQMCMGLFGASYVQIVHRMRLLYATSAFKSAGLIPPPPSTHRTEVYLRRNWHEEDSYSCFAAMTRSAWVNFDFDWRHLSAADTK